MPGSRESSGRSLVTYPGDKLRRRVLLAVRPIDTFTGAPANVPIRVALKEFPQARPIRTASGFFCFEGHLNEEENEVLYKIGQKREYTLVVEPDRVTADWYYLQPVDDADWSFEFTRKVTLPKADPKNPEERISFAPNPSYPFPLKSTLVRGKVVQPQAGVTGGAVVVRAEYDQADSQEVSSTIKQTTKTQINQRGDFVLFFKSMATAQQDITVIATMNGQEKQQSTKIREGEATKGVVLTFP
jgi:hypothetical protein